MAGLVQAGGPGGPIGYRVPATAPDGTSISALLDAMGLTNSTNGAPAGSATYCASASGYAAYATPTDIVCITGSASKIVIVTGLKLLMQSTAAALQTISVIKRSVANTGGTPTALTAIPYDSANAAATAVVNTYASAPSLGAAVGTIRVAQLLSGTLTAAPGAFATDASSGGPLFALSTGDYKGPIILRGAAESLCLNYGGAALTAGFTSIVGVEWVEFSA